ncbi:hypothetical protein DIPPA_10719 [Diplonema papillatum]|nr:hypothetical protein DIPPA_10719 [Diplonema papillatum]
MKGMLVDEARMLLFVAISSSDEPSVSMYNASDPQAPLLKDTMASVHSAYELALMDTILFVAAEQRLEIYDTNGMKFASMGSCCTGGPDMHIVGLQYFDGLVYASDWQGKLVVMNVTNPALPYYVGHRDLPSTASGNSNGKEGVVVITLSDDVTRVLLAADSGGLMVFSDIPPVPTAAPPTMMPAPPVPPFDCGSVTAEPAATGGCQEGTAMMTDHVVNQCLTEVCVQLEEGDIAAYDATAFVLRKTGGTCSLAAAAGLTTTHEVCGNPAPHIMYMEVHQTDVLSRNGLARDVAVLGTDSNDVFVATSTGLTIIHAVLPTSFRRAVHIDGNYYSVLPASDDVNIAYCLELSKLDVVDLSLETPKAVGVVTLPSTTCAALAQLHTWTGVHVIYASCHADGVFAIDVSDNAKPVLLNSGAAVFETSSEMKGLTVDDSRGILFGTTQGTTTQVAMYDIAYPAAPSLLDSAETAYSAYELVLSGSIVYVAVEKTLDVYQTENKVFEKMGWCCSNAPDMHIVGVAMYDDFVYASDWLGKLIAINVSVPSAPYYAGHRDLPRRAGFSANGKEGVAVAQLADGVVRVFQAADAAGLVIFSDEAPPATPMPRTPAPPPPMLPPDCSSLKTHVFADDKQYCDEGDVPMSYHVIEACKVEACALVAEGEVVGYDADEVFQKSSGVCSHVTPTQTVQAKYICGDAAPHTTYITQYSDEFLPRFSSAIDVTVLESHDNQVFVATTRGLAILSLSDEDNGHFESTRTVDSNYFAIIPAAGHTNTLLGLTKSALEVVSTSFGRVTESLTIASLVCANIAQLRLDDRHVAFCSCANDGIFGVDVTDIGDLSAMKGGKALVNPSSGQSKGMYVDADRSLLFVVTTGATPGLHMYSIEDPEAPSGDKFTTTSSGAYEVDMMGTIIYVAAGIHLDIFETASGDFSQLGWCCHYGPGLFLVGLQYFEGLVYASDYNSKVVVINVTDSSAPYYIGHRDMPAGSNGKEGIVVSAMRDNVVRVFGTGNGAGLIVLSDVSPGPTPAPDTRSPAVPSPPIDCGELLLRPVAEGTLVCPGGMVTESEHVVGKCSDELCALLADGELAMYDSPPGQYFKKSGSTCSFVSDPAPTGSKAVCGTPPPHLAYLEQHDDDILTANAVAREVAHLGSDSGDIVVATSRAIHVLRAVNTVRFRDVGSVAGNYFAVLPAGHNRDVLYGLRGDGMDVISLLPPWEPTKAGSVSLPSTRCAAVAEYFDITAHVVYASCHDAGVFAIDVSDDAAPMVLNNGSAAFLTDSGETKQVIVDQARMILFASTWGSNSAVHVLDVSNPFQPVEVGFIPTAYSAFDLALVGNTLYVAADDRLEIYDTTAPTNVKEISWCCTEETSPDLFIVGLAVYDDLVYASDYNSKVVVFNVSNPQAPYYVGHRDLPEGNGKEGIIAAVLNDGVVRVFQAADGGGLMIFSDAAPPSFPPRTPSPPPPELAPDCTDMVVSQLEDDHSMMKCEAGMVIMSSHMIDACTDLVCGQMTEGSIASFDGEPGMVLSKTGGSCTYVASTDFTDLRICGPAAPHTTYMLAYGDAVLPDGVQVTDVTVLGDRRDVAVANSEELTILRLDEDTGRLTRFGRVNRGYVAVDHREQDGDDLFGLRSRSIDVIHIRTRNDPYVRASVSLNSTLCSRLGQLKNSYSHIVYASCLADGVFAVDMMNISDPYVLNNGAAAMKPASGEAKGLLVDGARDLLFVVTLGATPMVHMYDILAPGVPNELDTAPTKASAHELTISDTIIYIAAETELEIMDTRYSVLRQLSTCCSHGPVMRIIGASYYNGFVYASDNIGKLVVINVTNPNMAYYFGHRDLPAESGGSGKEGIVVSMLRDNTVRVLQSADGGGLVVFSDTRPLDTPAPPTRVPRPAPKPAACADLTIEPRTSNRSECPDEQVAQNEHLILSCMDEVCAQLEVGASAQFDGPEGFIVKKSSASACEIVEGDGAAGLVCGPAAPYMSYVAQYDDNYIPNRARAMDIAVLGSDEREVVIASTGGVSVLHLRGYGSYFERSALIRGNYHSVLPAEDDPDIVYALRPNGLDVIIVSPPEDAEILGSVNVSSDSCDSMGQLRWSSSQHYIYASCGTSGIFAIDVSVNRAPALAKAEPVIVPPTGGETRSMSVDEVRATMYVTIAAGDESGIRKYTVSDPLAPVEEGLAQTTHHVYEVLALGNTVFVAANETLEIYDVSSGDLVMLSDCCSNGPEMQLVGIDVYDNMAFVSDSTGQMVVINVTDLADPYYIGHKETPGRSRWEGKEGVVASVLSDGRVRVLQAAGAAGMVMYSDITPPSTRPPRTSAPDGGDGGGNNVCRGLSLNAVDANDADAAQCPANRRVATREELDDCVNAVCQQMPTSSFVAFDGEDGLVLKKDESDQCAYASNSSTPERYVCIRSTGGGPPPTPPTGSAAANGDDNSESTGLLISMIAGWSIVMIGCLGVLIGYAVVTRSRKVRVDEELQDFEYMTNNKEIEPQLSDADILQATASHNSNYDKL